MNKLKIAILDSGIDTKHSNFKKIMFKETKNFLGNKSILLKDGHGTNVFDRIRKTIEKFSDISQFDFYDFQVFEERSYIIEKPIIKALRYCIDKKMDIINLSIGINADFTPPPELYSICNEIVNRGIILLASANNFGEICYPADFKFVLGVSAGIIEKYDQFGYDTNTDHFIGKGDFQRLADLNNKQVFRSGTSYATAHITGLLATFIQANNKNITTYQETIDSFKKNSVPDIRIINSSASRDFFTNINILSQDHIENTLQNYFSSDKFKWMQKVSIYPFSNKEFGTLKYFHNQFRFDLVNLFDFPRSLWNYKEIEIGDKIYKKHLDVSSCNKDFDTFILGYPEDIASFVNAKFYTDILEFCFSEEKNIFCLDPKVKNEVLKIKKTRGSANHIYSPGINKKDGSNLKSLLSLGKTKTPILAVAGTSSKCGKFSIQLKIRELLTREGYTVGWLSTEPQGELFGADFSFPYGFSSAVSIPADNWINTIPGIMKGIEMTSKPHIIISGHQSWFLPFSKQLSGDARINNVAFMYGVMPDALICSVSSHDTFEYIERNLNTMKYCYQTPVLFLALSELVKEAYKDKEGNIMVQSKIMSEEEWEENAYKLQKAFNLPVYNVYSEKHNDLILNKIQCFYS